MESKRIQILVDKFLSNTASQSEKDELNQWYRDAHQEEVEWLHTDDDEEKILEQRLLVKLNSHINQQYTNPNVRKTGIFSIPKAFRIAGIAAACIIIGIFMIYRTTDRANTPQVSFSAPADQTENTFVLLPDSSKVILRSGSKISYQYTDSLREIYLTGNGFFEVTKNKKRPFLVHAGNIITRVLGTSFSVESDSDKHIKVAVKTGRVAIQNTQKNTLAVLTPNQAIDYDKKQNSIRKTAVVPAEQLNWVNMDMRFTDVPFGKLAAALTRRYHTDISFENENLRNCLLTGYFEGTESLPEVLDILTKTAGATVAFKGNKIVLTGEGCPKQTL
ncbi:FecR family protein [Sphingobacterium detergens]|uniref:FecR family protein n=1 Tax=Sphingobacterium detergens TaxID=1145106 RepID=UPI003AAC6D47